MKKLLGILLALALLLGCTVAFADPITLTYAEVNPVPATLEENNVGDVAWAFKAKLEELSGGEILVDLQGGGVLGSEDQSWPTSWAATHRRHRPDLCFRPEPVRRQEERVPDPALRVQQ